MRIDDDRQKREPQEGSIAAIPCGLRLMPRVISKVNEYRANAAECRRKAESAESASAERMWRDMSESWLGMIGFAEREDYATEELEHSTNRSMSRSSH